MGSASARAAETTARAGATLDAAASRIRFTAQDVRLTVVAAPPGHGMTFPIAGLTDPTVIVAHGTKVTVEVINGDPPVPHSWALTADAPPFGGVPAAAGAAVAVLGPTTASEAQEAKATFTAPAPPAPATMCAPCLAMRRRGCTAAPRWHEGRARP